MKTSEVFKALEKNPNLKFVCKNGNKEYFLYTEKVFSTFYGLQCRLNGEIIGSKADAANFFGNIKIDADWQLVPQSVTWQEALQAFIDGKKIKCEGCPGCYDGDVCNDMQAEIIDPFGKRTPCAEQLKHGTWYILDGNANG